MPSILAIDQGTTSTKAYRTDASGEVTLVGSRSHRQIRPHAGWVEHDAAELLGHIRELIDMAGPVDMLGLANQGETVIAWDAGTGRPVGNAIVWQDDRTAAVTTQLRDDGHEALTLARSGLPLDPYFSATKLRWLLDHGEGATALHAQGRLRLGTSDAFFIAALTGVFATDVSTASRTGLMDLKACQWDSELCALFGVPVECLPEIRPTVGDFGRLPGGARLIASAVDQQASLFGHDCQNEGDIKITFGTGAFALGLTGAAPKMDNGAGLLPTVAWQLGAAPAQYALDGGILTAGSALEWLRGVGLLDDFTLLDAESGDSDGSAAARGLFFVPAQGGLGCPYWDRTARGGWIGIGLDTPRADLARAVVEGIALRAAQIVDAFARAAAVGRISIDGGLSQSRYFCQFLADVLNREVSVADSSDLTALGMLRLCATALASPISLPGQWRHISPRPGDQVDIRKRFDAAVERVRGWA
jgi:glycerol kinase